MARKTRRFRIGYARPSFLEGMARLMDVGGTLNEYDIPGLEELRQGRGQEALEKMRAGYTAWQSGPEADAEALREIWEDVGQYLYDAIGQFEEENELPSEGWKR